MQIFPQIIPNLFHFYLLLPYIVVFYFFDTIYSVFNFTFYLKDFNFAIESYVKI